MNITTTRTVEEILKDGGCPLPVDVIPDRMGINLCSVKSLTWTKQPDGQLTELVINFIPGE